MSPLERQVAMWATDHVGLATKFGKTLVDSPSSIHNLILSFCPAESALKKAVWKY